MNEIRREHMEWIVFVLADKGWNRAELSRQAGIDPTTLSKFFNDKLQTAGLSTQTIRKIEECTGLPAFKTTKSSVARGLSENEAAPYLYFDNTAPHDRAVRAWINDQPALDPWLLNSRALELLGYMPGDILLVDLNKEAQTGDVVCAQSLDNRGGAETIFRTFEPPFLVAASMETALHKPLLIDDDRTTVMGTVVGSVRAKKTA
ncbi:MAG: helix-turn-helix transcriptional regulator [Gammaproteobacteria bacterium]|nr:helix-turn-helix transcriptional regulator [Gammaproteobacteria bacterium]